jgi:hypothetical protein
LAGKIKSNFLLSAVDPHGPVRFLKPYRSIFII